MIKAKLLAILIGLSLSTFAQVPDARGVLHVKKGAAGNGSSWNNAMGEVADALRAAGEINHAENMLIKQIWVAAGTYYPLYLGDPSSGSDPRDKTFLMAYDVKLYGGFAGTESTLYNRNLSRKANETILSGDIGVPNDYTDNVRHVVVSVQDLGRAELNGFTVVKGYASGAGYVGIQGCPVLQTGGGGMFGYRSNIKIINTTFASNRATVGGAIYLSEDSNITMTNSVISGNAASPTGGNGAGGGMFTYRSSCTFTNVTISGNYASSYGGAIAIMERTTTSFRNSIVHGNSSGIYVYYNDVYTLRNSLVQGLDKDVANGVLDGKVVNPLFINAPNASTAPFIGGDYRLSANSACVNTGSNVLFTGLDANSTDIEGKGRVYLYSNGGVIDMGAYEHGSHVLPVRFGAFRAKQQGMAIDLKWHTYTERDNSHFLISRSTDGIDYSVLGQIKGEGNTSTVQNYSFRDSSPLNGSNYYRLTQVDQNGSAVVLAETVLNFEWAGVAVSAYPIPTKDKLHVNFTSGRYKSMTLIDLNGKVLMQQIITAQQNAMPLSLASYPPGVYLLCLSNESEKAQVRVVKE
jgi:hypothetical protein